MGLPPLILSSEVIVFFRIGAFRNLKSISFSDLKLGWHFPILGEMHWVTGTLILATVAVVVRRALHMGDNGKAQRRRQASLRPDLQALYTPVEQEVAARTTILGITLNDAFGEREANRHDMAWHIVRLAVGEWERATELTEGLQNLISRFLPDTNGVAPLRRVAISHFKSRAVRDYVGLYEFLDQLLFSPKHRFGLQLRLLFHGSTVLSKEFKRACRRGHVYARLFGRVVEPAGLLLPRFRPDQQGDSVGVPHVSGLPVAAGSARIDA